MYYELKFEMELPDDFGRMQDFEAALIAAVKGLGANVKMVHTYNDKTNSRWSYNVDPEAVVPMYLTD